ncbi:MAG: ABC-F family ATP-binding cassette domain-containing protein [Cryomorphaceae bacterium]
MNYLSVDRLAKHLGERTLFQNISFGLAKGEKVALIANNGTGKTSLLNILAGKDIPDEGEYNFRKGIRVAYLEQQPSLDEDQSIEEFITSANSETLSLIEEYNQKLERSSGGDANALKDLEEVQHRMDARNAWDHDRQLRAMLSRFGVVDLKKKIAKLSGGERKRLALALTLLDQPDLLILDEPTNHLDIEMVEWLEDYLGQSNLTLLMVTHDRYFLDRVCNVILEMHRGKLYKHNGNYSYFLQKRAEREEVLQTEIDKAGKLMKKELEWVRRQPKARTTKSKARLDAYDEIEAKAKSGVKEQELVLDVKMSRIGGKILELKKVYKRFDDKELIKGFDYTFKRGERIGIIGKNGVGKSTFLNIITQQLKPDSGKVNVGDTIVYGYYTQGGLKVKEDKRVIEVLKDIAEVIQLSDGSKLTASAFLQYFLFPPEMQYTQVSKLSGGERRRLHLMTVLMKNPNFLILDEPTNDLDLLTLTRLEEFLENFGGCMIIVSHDRYFLDKLVDHLFIFEHGEIRDFWGSYAAYREESKAELKERSNPKVATKQEVESNAQANVVNPTKRLSYKEKYELEQIEKEMPVLEKKKSELEHSLLKGELGHEAVEALSIELHQISERLDELTTRWIELDDLK